MILQERMFGKISVVVAAFLLLASQARAFLNPNAAATKKFSSPLSMAPRFDKATQKWVPTSEAEGPAAGYGLTKTLLLHGPQPFFTRLTQPEQYEQAVLKFMAGDKCSREEAQGNMDKYFVNPQDWAYERMECERRGIKPDYVTLDPKQIVLTLVWSTIVLTVGGRVLYSLTNDVGFWDFYSS